jgi:hypothetical protein
MVRRLAFMTLGLLLSACSQNYVRPVSIAPEVTHLEVRERTLGTHWCCLVIDDVPWVTDGRSILVLDSRGRVQREIELGQTGEHAPIVDMARNGDTVVAVLEGDEVHLVDASDPRHPEPIRRIGAHRLGLSPERVAIIDGEAVVYGPEGAVRLSDRHRLLKGNPIESMAHTPDGGWYVQRRRMHRLHDGAYIGTASLLAPSPTGACAFARNQGDAALLGVLSADATEADPAKLTVAVPGRVRRMRFDDDGLLVVSTAGLHRWVLHNDELQQDGFWAQPGLRDATHLSGGLILAVGEHGRSVIDLTRHDGGREVHRHEAPGGLRDVRTANGLLVGRGAAGVFAFEPGQRVRRVMAMPSDRGNPATSAATLEWSIELQDDGSALVTTPLGESTLQAPDGSRFTCVTSTGDAFWLGHEQGITRLAPPSVTPQLPDVDPQAGERIDAMMGSTNMSVRLGGPVLSCTALVLGRGVAYATAHDGFGLVVERKAPR